MIEDYGFGKMRIDGKEFTKDLKIINGEVIPNWWRKQGHSVEPADIEDILQADPDVLILGKGKPGMMKSSAPLRELLEQQGIELIEQSTSKALKTFNELTQQGKRVCAGFHLTC